jgi:hypothetical protein
MRLRLLSRGDGDPDYPAWDGELFFNYLHRLAGHLGYIECETPKCPPDWPGDREPGEDD